MSEKSVSGIQVYYYFVCKRKLWYFSNEISMESDNENVRLGKIIDENTYKNHDKHIMIDNTINIDFMAEHSVIHEIKKSRKIEEASVWQVKYYLYYLKERGVENLKGKIDYPLLKQSMIVELTNADIIKIKEVLVDIQQIVSSKLPPLKEHKKFCKSCAYYDLCFI